MEKTRLDNPIAKYTMFVPLLFLFVVVITFIYYQKTPSLIELISFVLSYAVFIIVFIYYTKNLREVYFDETSIYIKPFFRKRIEKINYSNVVELKEKFKSIPSFGSKAFLLKYKVDANFSTVKFFAVKNHNFNQFQKRVS